MFLQTKLEGHSTEVDGMGLVWSFGWAISLLSGTDQESPGTWSMDQNHQMEHGVEEIKRPQRPKVY